MKPVISIGNQNFESIRKGNAFYIDKTPFIREWWENQDTVTLITRPRRFGKTLNLNMLDCFFSRKYEGRGDLFEGLSIWDDEKYRNLQGTCPVIFLSFANIKGETYEKARNGILYALAKLYSIHNYVGNASVLDEKDLSFFRAVSPDMPDEMAALSIQYLSGFMNHYFGKKVLILLDEYDTPLQEAYINGYWDQMASFIRSLLKSTFKTNPYLERGIMTGITRVSKESIFSDLNNLEIVTTTSEKYSTAFGFTEEEVFQALTSCGRARDRDQVRQWYDGFTFGNTTDIYNPWSITNFLESGEWKCYWANTSSNSLISKLLREGASEIKVIMEDLLNGGELVTEIDEEIIFQQLSRKRGAIWSLLLASGYLKISGRSFSNETGKFIYHLQLTNREVRIMFDDMIADWFADDAIPYQHFLKAFLLGDVEYMNEYMNQIAEIMFSSFDTGTKPSAAARPERFYHGFVLGLIVELAGEYRISSNRESGFGRYDVMLEPLKKGKPAFVLEFKVRNPRREASLSDTLKAALTQMDEKHYDRELLARGIKEDQIRHYGFAFEGKQVLIG